jgi:hypothetical protein
MNRRTFAERAVAVLPIVGVTGCVGSAPSGDGTETESPDSDETSGSTDATATEQDTETTAPGTAEATATPATTTDTGTATDVETAMGTAMIADDTKTATVPTGTTTTLTPVRRTAGNVSAAFTITDYAGPGDVPSDETATARFEPDRSRIVVTGTVFVDTCGRLTLLSVREGNEAVKIVVGTDEYGPSNATTTIGCEREAGAVSYEVTIAIEGDLPKRVEVVHQEGDEETFTIAR